MVRICHPADARTCGPASCARACLDRRINLPALHQWAQVDWREALLAGRVPERLGRQVGERARAPKMPPRALRMDPRARARLAHGARPHLLIAALSSQPKLIELASVS